MLNNRPPKYSKTIAIEVSMKRMTKGGIPNDAYLLEGLPPFTNNMFSIVKNTYFLIGASILFSAYDRNIAI